MSVLNLPNVTLWASMHSRDEEYFHRTMRVLIYCHKVLNPAKTVFFSRIPCICMGIDWVISDATDYFDWRTFVNFVWPKHFTTDFALQVHEDGFPIDVSQWTDDFFDYDYIGSPWPHKIVGNGGFTMESKAFYTKKMTLPVPPTTTLPDVYLCSEKKAELEAMGLRFAPFELAQRFGCEFPGFKHIPHFGFHGQSPEGDYARAWEILEATE